LEQNVPWVELNALSAVLSSVSNVAKSLAVLAAVVLVVCLLQLFLPAQGVPTLGKKGRVEDNWSQGVWIFSPLNTTYASDTLLLNVTAKRGFSPREYNPLLKYSLNGEENVTVPASVTFVDMSIPDTIFSWLASYTLISGQISLPKLPEGTNSLTVYGIYNRAQGVDPKYPNMYDIQTIYFTVNNGVAPSVKLLQFGNVTYEKEDLPVDFAVNEPTSWMGYSFDGQDNVTVSGNFTLPELSLGEHNVTVYAKDLLGNMGSSETTSFNVVEPMQTEPWLLGVIVCAAAMGLTFLIYNRRKAISKGLTKQTWRSSSFFVA
jgi:hypothetical protein